VGTGSREENAAKQDQGSTMTDLILAIAHHLLVFSLAGIIGAEFFLLRQGIGRDRLEQLGRIDLFYGVLATLIVIVGFCRVFFGVNGSGFYLPNPVFWLKIGAFVVVGLLSIGPTIAIARWRRAAKQDTAYIPPAAEVSRARMFLVAEVVVFAFIPIFAAAMARGYGL
jgi:putative membrane protein